MASTLHFDRSLCLTRTAVYVGQTMNDCAPNSCYDSFSCRAAKVERECVSMYSTQARGHVECLPERECDAGGAETNVCRVSISHLKLISGLSSSSPLFSFSHLLFLSSLLPLLLISLPFLKCSASLQSLSASSFLSSSFPQIVTPLIFSECPQNIFPFMCP